MEGELRGPADDRHGLLRILDSRQLDDDPPVARALEAGLSNTQLVYPASEDLECPVDRIGVGPALWGVLGFEDDLGPPTQVEAEARWTGRNDRPGRPDHEQNGKDAPPQMWSHGFPPLGAAAHAAAGMWG
jgi:hypothetical protein